jgi:hypothetical protein
MSTMKFCFGTKNLKQPFKCYVFYFISVCHVTVIYSIEKMVFLSILIQRVIIWRFLRNSYPSSIAKRWYIMPTVYRLWILVMSISRTIVDEGSKENKQLCHRMEVLIQPKNDSDVYWFESFCLLCTNLIIITSQISVCRYRVLGLTSRYTMTIWPDSVILSDALLQSSTFCWSSINVFVPEASCVLTSY